MSGILFDIQRFGLHDGPGIRTVVFLKGCPLHCLWCHNPESQSRQSQIRFRAEACTLCGACVPACPKGAHQVSAEGHLFNRQVCERSEQSDCGECNERCVQECLFEALQLCGRDATAAEVMAEVRRDLGYYKASGGGLTLTGGEPLAQPGFCAELLEQARSEGIHTCLETSGCASREAIQRILPFVDLFLYDFKASGGSQARLLTGAPEDLPLANLAYLLERGAAVWLRCPLVAGVNDTPLHLGRIAQLAAQYPQLERIELLPYHNIGSSKYAEYGMTNPLPNMPTTPDEIKQGWLDELHCLGCARAALG